MHRFSIYVLLTALWAIPLHAQELSDADKERNVLKLAGSLKQQGDYTRAAEAYQQLAANVSVAGFMGLASISRAQVKASDAVALLRKALTIEPGNTRVLSQLGYAMIANKQQEEAVNVFDGLLAMQPDNAMAHNGKAVAFDSAGNHVAAQEIYQTALLHAPDSAAIKNNLALSMVLNDQFDEAIALLEPLVVQPDATATMRQNLALAYGMKGDDKRARELNSKDVTPQQAEENLQFYKHYAKLKKEHRAPEMESAFDDAGSEPVTLVGAKERSPQDVVPSAGQSEEKDAATVEEPKKVIEEKPPESEIKKEAEVSAPAPEAKKEAEPEGKKAAEKPKAAPPAKKPVVAEVKKEAEPKPAAAPKAAPAPKKKKAAKAAPEPAEESSSLFGKDAVYSFPSPK
jgi:Flp pilus assembly protein TadD